MVATRSMRKSFGRSWRSVDMITQRPVTASLRSSGIESVLIDLDCRLPRLEVDRDDVEPARDVVETMAHHVVHRQPHDPPALARCHGFGRVAECPVLARLHFDKDQRRTVAGDDIHLAAAPAVTPGHNRVAGALQLTTGEILAPLSKDDPIPRHLVSRRATPRPRGRSNQRALHRFALTETPAIAAFIPTVVE